MKDLYKLSKTGGSWDYLIPGDLIKHPWITNKVNVVPGKDSYVNQRIIIEAVRYCCELELQDFYDQVWLKLESKEERPHCLNCGEELTFTGKLSQGYKSHTEDYSTDGDGNFCCRSCMMEYIHHSEKYPDRGFKNYITHARTCRNFFLNRGNADDKCSLYLALTEDGLKFGITTDIEGRFRRSDGYFIKIIELIHESRLKIAELEYLAKVKLFHRASEHLSFKESIRLIHFIKDLTNPK